MTETEGTGAPKIVRVHWFTADGEELVLEEPYPTREEMEAYVQGQTEHVSVLYNCKPAGMFVHEWGRRQWADRNEPATQIYFAASRARGIDPEDLVQAKSEVDKLAESMGVKPENVIYLEKSEGMSPPPGIYGPAILIEEPPQ